MARRGSTYGAGVETRTTGQPHQVYSEVIGTGKTLEQTKRKVRWVIAFPDLDYEIEVILKHSLVSGKKTIYENNHEIVSASNLFATDFSHGWTSTSCGRFFRIEASVTLSQDNYVFSVDGVRFFDMPRVPIGGFKKETNATTSGRYAAVTAPASTTAHASTVSTSAPSRQSQPRGSASASLAAQEFDPFASSSAPADPFAQPLSGSTQPSGAKQSNLLFDDASDPFAGSDDPFAAKHKPAAVAASNAFDPFASPAAPAPVSARAAAPVTVNTAASAPVPDFFALPAAPSTPVAKAHPQTQPQAFDPFAAAPLEPPVFTASSSGRRQSASDIARDFADLSFSAAPALTAQQAQPAQQQSVLDTTAVNASQSQQGETENAVDPWHAGLVDLDLSGKQSAARRASVNAANTGPSLSSLMTSAPQQRRSSMTANAAMYSAPVIPLSPPLQTNPNPRASFIGSAPGQPMPMQIPQPNFGNAPMPANTMGYSAMGAPGYSGYSAPPATTQQTTQSSSKSALDSLDWKSFQ